MKILIFKTDKIGDLINISSIFKNLKDHGYNIDIICSEYNSRVAKFYDFFDKIYLKNSFISFFKKNHDILNREYDFVLQLDGSKWSFFTAIFMISKVSSHSKPPGSGVPVAGIMLESNPSTSNVR